MSDLRSLHEASYTTVQNGKEIKVNYVDAALIGEIANLYSAIEGDFKGTPSTASEAVKGMMAGLQAGRVLSDEEWILLEQLRKKYAKELRQIEHDNSEGLVVLPSVGQGRIEEAASLLSAGELARIREQYSTASTTKKDRDITAPHLHDGTMHDLAHAMQHAARLQDKDVLGDPASVAFNVEHVLNHLKSGIDHGSRLGQHLEEHPSNPATWAKEKLTLHQLRESAPKPPPGLDMAKHDEAQELANPDKPVRECGTCEMYDPLRQRCWSYEDANGDDIYVSTEWVCRSWSLAPDWRQQHAKIHGRMSESDHLRWVAENGGSVDLVALAGRPTVRVYRMREDTKPTVALDFDGVIYDRAAEQGGSNLTGNPIKGTELGLAELARDFRIVVLTARPNPKAVRGWLDRHDLSKYIADVTNHKTSASAYVDNRSLYFQSWPQVVGDLQKGNNSTFESNIPGGTT